jgi:hypothetical protein
MPEKNSSAPPEPDPSPSGDDSSDQIALDQPTLYERAWNVLQGRPKNFRDPGIFHKISLIAFLAWVGLGADGLSSSAYRTFQARSYRVGWSRAI